MINYIISDDYNDAVKTKNIIENYMMNFDIEVKYHLFNIEDNLKDKIKDIKGFKVYILNNDPVRYYGIDYAEYIRSELDDWNSIIILVSKHSESSNDGMGKKLFLFDYIIKNCFFDNMLKEDIKNIMKHYDNREHCLTFESNRIVTKLDFRNIETITKEKNSKKCIINSSVGNYYTSESLKDVSKRLDNRFVKINRSCIVNGDKVVEYDLNRNKITMKNGLTMFEVSRENKKDFFYRMIDRK
jgi:DNA-binding LytR/AlgR family response regulator